MLINFHSPSAASITMFGDIAKDLLGKMGMSGAVPGALRPEDVPAALARLEKALAASEGKGRTDDDDDKDAPVSLSNRAYPLIQLLKSAINHKEHVMWD